MGGPPHLFGIIHKGISLQEGEKFIGVVRVSIGERVRLVGKEQICLFTYYGKASSTRVIFHGKGGERGTLAWGGEKKVTDLLGDLETSRGIGRGKSGESPTFRYKGGGNDRQGRTLQAVKP